MTTKDLLAEISDKLTNVVTELEHICERLTSLLPDPPEEP